MPRCHPSSVCHWYSKSSALWEQSRVQVTGQSLGWWTNWLWWHPWQKSDVPFILCSSKSPLETCDISRCVSKICPPRQRSWLPNRCGQHIFYLWSCNCCPAIGTTSTSSISTIFPAICSTTFLWLHCSATFLWLHCSTTIWATSLQCFFFSVMLFMFITMM